MAKTASTKERNDGTKLENLVEFIESTFHPNDFEVKPRERVKDDEGNIIAELDILITGKVGQCPYKLLVECRDRPSVGPQGQSWIEQLHGRKVRFGFHNVIAVSSTGFTNPAKKAAAELGIQLRTFSEIPIADTWFPKSMCWLKHDLYVHSPRIIPIVPEEKTLNQEFMARISSTTVKIVNAESLSEVKPLKLWNTYSSEYSPKLGCATKKTVQTVVTVDGEFLNAYRMKFEDDFYPIEKIIFPIDNTTSIISVPLSKLGSYTNENGEGNLAGTFYLKNEQFELSTFVIANPKDGDE